MKALRKALYYLALWLVALFFFSPIAWIALASLKTKDEILATPPLFVFQPTLANYTDFFARPNIGQYFINSIALSVVSVLVAILVSFMAAYCFSRFQPKGTNFMMFLLLSIRMVPAAASVVPLFLMYTAFGWKDNWLGIMLFYAMFSIPFSVWILKGFIDGVSLRYDETALVNGGSRLHVLFKVVLPQVRPGLIAAFIFNFIFVWNEFLINFIIGGRNTTTIPNALMTGVANNQGTDWTFVATITTIFIIPPIIAIYFFQKYLLVGMTFGTVRGEV
jgi:multiple sugar transport system permease protein